MHNSESLISALKSLIVQARESGAKVIYIMDDDVGEVGSAEWKVPAAIAARPQDLLVRKAACDAFHETTLGVELRKAGIRHLVICGVKTEFCIDTTCRRAVSEGYAVTLVRDAHSTNQSGALDAPHIVSHHNQLLNEFGAYVDGQACEIIVSPACDVKFDRSLDVPSSVEKESVL